MIDAIKTYVAKLNEQFSTGVAHEHSYRGPLQNLLVDLLPKGYTVVNEPTREKCGAPDYIILKAKTPVAYIEAKDLFDNDIDGRKEHKEQFDRYKRSLDHIIFTDYLDFHLYENGDFVDSVRLAEARGDKIVVNEEFIDKFTQLVDRLAKATPQRITSPSRLASVMAGKARLLANVIEQALLNDKEQTSELAQQMKVFQEFLIHDLNEKTFADIYAQTIAYGLFSARLNDPTPEDFSREEANELIPKSNPFLRKIFNDIAGYNVDSRIAWIVDDLVEVFRVTDMSKVMRGFGGTSGRTDPMMHFYEDFLGQYDPALRDKRGVYYTPQPVVDFIVRAVDDILKRDFGLPMGLADSSKIKHEVVNEQFMRGVKGSTKKMKKELHRVQILDPATGTGTFLATVIRQIHANMEGQWGAWNDYVEKHLLPRLNGFELMMASYTIAHLKLNMVLRETGYTPQSDQRLRVYLTNSLEEYNAETGTLFSAAISNESNEASYIKRDTPVMVMMGNPPYSVSSSNNSDYITHLIDSYKKDLNERNIQPLSDDYIKFIRLGQEYISRTGEGILAFICNNSFVDGIIHRQMRKVLMQKFDEIYILDLHGNGRKKEVAPDGSKDENVFDIMQGVSINILVKKPQKAEGCKVYHCDLFGGRKNKYDYLDAHRLNDVEWEELTPQEPQYFFVPKDFSVQEEYEKGFKIENLIQRYSSGVKTSNDNELVSFEPFSNDNSKIYYFRPFDIRFIDYDLQKVARHRYGIMKYFEKDNLAILACKQAATDKYGFFVSKGITDINYTGTAGQYGAGLVFPLYLYSEDGEIRVPNLNKEIWGKINIAVDEETTPETLFDYIYAVLHSPAYRTKYKEFLKIDFPRIPYPTSAEEYHRLSGIGSQLRKLHLMEEVPATKLAQFNNPGSNVVDKPEYKGGSVWINKEQCFEDVPETAWNFYIGGYQPAQKWLKDRKGRELTFDDIAHYRKIIAVLMETDCLMKMIDTKNS
ncbi:MAG: N-6 DNA methylase [Bacteroidales bacterium]|nr:N-6 DNA methylase [Bacteroidales bacterium]